ncbi:MAG: hypothetical protein FWG25_07995 [Promicromonosporaceae bacterium]|nr:hypothetical protein [Promicromonosporaceae bacterium]
MPENDVEWTVEFARNNVRDAIAKIVDDATPGLIERLAGDPSAYGQLVAITKLVSDEADQLLRETVISARHSGLNWERIGDVVGMSRQEAQQTYGSKIDDAAIDASNALMIAPGAQADMTAHRLPPIGTRVHTKLDELVQLNRGGPYGWHAVAYQGGYFVMEFDDQQWNHATSYRNPPPGGGWQRIARWGPWIYWARPTGLPILPGAPEPNSFASDSRLRKELRRNLEGGAPGLNAGGLQTVGNLGGAVIGGALNSNRISGGVEAVIDAITDLFE